ncbi:hypothetical protein B0H14DRAFT_2625803 [Mycena olivaceomarginata]|nr:hypothetical protein B0H14DRAFT_2625803 [Mycena olivaceomarginata]
MGNGGMGEKHTQARDEKRQAGKKKWARQTSAMGESTHELETRRQEKGEKHALAREKARKSQQDKHGQWGKSTHKLETRRREKMSKTNMGDGGKACTRWRREGEKK